MKRFEVLVNKDGKVKKKILKADRIEYKSFALDEFNLFKKYHPSCKYVIQEVKSGKSDNKMVFKVALCMWKIKLSDKSTFYTYDKKDNKELIDYVKKLG